MPDPIRGRWTIESLEPWEKYNGGDGNASVIGPTVNEPVEVVPVPDEQATERAAIATYEARVHSTVINGWGSEPEALRERFRKAARIALAAALEQPE